MAGLRDHNSSAARSLDKLGLGKGGTSEGKTRCSVFALALRPCLHPWLERSQDAKNAFGLESLLLCLGMLFGAIMPHDGVMVCTKSQKIIVF